MSAFNIGFVIFPNLTQLDFTGPLQVLSRLPGAKIQIAAKTREPVPAIAASGSFRHTRSPIALRSI